MAPTRVAARWRSRVVPRRSGQGPTPASTSRGNKKCCLAGASPCLPAHCWSAPRRDSQAIQGGDSWPPDLTHVARAPGASPRHWRWASCWPSPWCCCWPRRHRHFSATITPGSGEASASATRSALGGHHRRLAVSIPIVLIRGDFSTNQGTIHRSVDPTRSWMWVALFLGLLLACLIVLVGSYLLSRP